uniref:Glycosyltransferase 2-like domain-containing protein n=1 Tax=viral metagenome TaxID=1070528 RepID=A0A6C0ICG6_9ZZZZ
MLLSILICTVPQRKEFLRRLCESLYTQLATSKYKDIVEIIVAEDDFKITTGQKRNILIEKSIGKYVCFIDDDDTISDNYISALLPILEKDTYDCVGWKYRFVFYGEPIGPLGTISLQNTEWLDTIERLCKPICHLSQVRAHIASSVKFPDRSHGEDALWSKEICKLLKNEYFLDELMYNYQACPNFSIAEKKENVENFKSFLFTDFDFEKMETLNFRHLKFE